MEADRTKHTSAERRIPDPEPAHSPYLVGALYFPGWKEGTHWGWDKVAPFPERRPLLGWYDEHDPDVADWEIKWALEHGISFFAYCWYRGGSAGRPVTVESLQLGHAIHEALFRSRFVGRFRFCFMWENQSKGNGVASLDDLKTNLLPFWVENYLTHPSYLVIDRKPVVMVYAFDRLIEDLGGEDGARAGLEAIREACTRAGFDGAILMQEYRGQKGEVMDRIRRVGFDYAFAYCWHPQERFPTPAAAVEMQLRYVEAWREAGRMPFVPTITMGWDPMPWANPDVSWLDPARMSRFRIPPREFAGLCARVRGMMAGMPADGLGQRMALLDNWNEWGEGHYLAPHAEYGFGYLDAFRDVFTDAPREHKDIGPADVGLGPYETLYRAKHQA